MKRFTYILFFLVLTILISACSDTNKENTYDATKKMVVDILQTDDGKKALIDIITNEKVKHQLVIESDIVKEAVDSMFTSQEHQKMWNELFQDPTFVETYVKSTKEAQKEVFKKLMLDATYQEQMLQLLKNPEITEQIQNVVKGQQFRSHLEEIIQETFENPLFQAKLTDILLEIAGQKSKSSDKKSDQHVDDEQEQEDEDENTQNESNEEEDQSSS